MRVAARIAQPPGLQLQVIAHMKHHPLGAIPTVQGQHWMVAGVLQRGHMAQAQAGRTGRAGQLFRLGQRGLQGSAPRTGWGGQGQHQHDGPGVAFGKAAQLPAQTAQLRLRCAREHGPGIQNAQTRPSGQARAAHFVGPGSQIFLAQQGLLLGREQHHLQLARRIGLAQRGVLPQGIGLLGAGRQHQHRASVQQALQHQGPPHVAAGFIGGQQHSGRAHRQHPHPSGQAIHAHRHRLGRLGRNPPKTLPPRAPVFSCRHSVCHLKNPNRAAPGAVGPPRARAPGQ